MILKGDCIQVMKAIKPNSIDAIVTDPPYNLHFMGKAWDKDLLHERWLIEVFKVMKPGASMLVMGGTRTFHRLACAIEDTGFIIKDTLMWIYGSGFPKAQDLGKMIDKRGGKERKVIGKRKSPYTKTGRNTTCYGKYDTPTDENNYLEYDVTIPTSSLAKHWDGFKIGGIKPAYEPIIWAVKPPEGSYIDNVLKWGVGAINVDECRVSLNGEQSSTGRFPANIILDEEAGGVMDEMSGKLHGAGNIKSSNVCKFPKGWGYKKQQINPNYHFNNGGGASRFFYCAKASKSERGEDNNHPTVKPISLMSWLIKLVTREGQVVLDPFLGSGTTGISAIKSNRKFVGIEREDEYLEIAQKRIKYCESHSMQMNL